MNKNNLTVGETNKIIENLISAKNSIGLTEFLETYPEAGYKYISTNCLHIEVLMKKIQMVSLQLSLIIIKK